MYYKRAVTVASATLLVAVALADNLRTIYIEEFDRYGDATPGLTADVAIREAPASLKHLAFKGEKAATAHKTMFKLPTEPACLNYDFEFLVRYPRNSSRTFDLTLFSSATPDDPRSLQRLVVTVAENGSYFKTAPAAAVPAVRLTGREAALAPFPDNRWHRVQLQVRGRSATLFVERDGVMVREALAEAHGLPLVGYNFASATPLHLDSITLRAGEAVLPPDFIQRGARQIATHAAIHNFAVAPEAVETAFVVRSGSYPAGFTVNFTTRDGTNQLFTFRAMAQNHSQLVQREVAELVEGKLVKSRKFVNESLVLPDAGFNITGPAGFKLPLFTRPRLQYRYEPEQAARIVARWESYPAGSESDLHLRVVRTGVWYEVWFDGKYATRFPAATPLASVATALATGGEIEFLDAQPPAQPLTGRAALQLPLDIARNARPGPLAGARTSLERYATVAGVRFIVADGTGSLDTGRCRENLGSFALECDGYLQRSAFDGMPESLHFQVPTAQYLKAYALCAVADHPDKVPVVTARLTKFRPGDGRQQAVCDDTIELPRQAGAELPAAVRLAGEVNDGDRRLPLYLVEFNFDAGAIQDVLLLEENPFLDFEFLGKLYDKDNYYLNRNRKPALEQSSVQIFAATLEQSPVVFETVPGRLTSTYYPDEKATITARLTALQAGSYGVKWEVRNLSGEVLEQGERQYRLHEAGAGASVEVAPAQKEYGWYGVRFEVTDERGSSLFRQENSLALLPPDRRRAGYESPYFVWNFFGAHGTPRQIEVIGDLLKRMGVRRTLLRNLGEEDVAEWGLTLGQFRYLRFKGETPAEREADAARQIGELVAKYPHVKSALIFHEGGGGPFPLELIGGTTEVDEAEAAAQQRVLGQALFVAQMWRKYAPEVKLVVGNSGESLGIVARLMRAGLPRDYIDMLGEESVGMTMPPERSVAYANWQLRELARVMGYGEIPVEACFEWKSRIIRHLGPEKQAAFRTRDALIGLAWRQQLVPVIGISEMANSYYNTIWGDGAFTRYPLLQPHPVMPATATLTQVLDGATFVRLLPTGSLTVYALEFKQGNNYIYALWTTRGEVAAELELAEETKLTQTALTGATTQLTTADKHLALTLSESPLYLAGPTPLTAVTVALQRDYPGERYPGSAQADIVAPMSDLADWHLVEGLDQRLETPHMNPAFAAIRRPGAFALSQVEDEQQGPSLELTHLPTNNCPALMQEYVFLRPTAPVAVAGRPATIGLWVKGNSSLGKIFWEIEDAEGERWLAAGTAGYGCNSYDWPDQAAINFDGWHLLQFPITELSPVKVYSPGENQWQWQHDGSGNRQLDYPIKVTGVGVMQYRQVLHLLEMEPVTTPLRLKGVVAY